LSLPAFRIEYTVVTKGGNSSQADPITADLNGSALGVNDRLHRHITS
jgi:hypothetical protein